MAKVFQGTLLQAGVKGQFLCSDRKFSKCISYNNVEIRKAIG